MTANPTSSAITSLSFSPAGAPAAPGGRAVQQLLAVGEPRVPSMRMPNRAQQQRLVWCQLPKAQLQKRGADTRGWQMHTLLTGVCLVLLAIPPHFTWELCHGAAFMASKVGAACLLQATALACSM